MRNGKSAGKPPSKKRRKGGVGPRKAAVETTAQIIDRLFLRKLRIPLEGGGEQKMTALEAIMHQLTWRQREGDDKASRVLQKYEELARHRIEAPLQIAIVDSDYTQTLAAPTTEDDDG